MACWSLTRTLMTKSLTSRHLLTCIELPRLVSLASKKTVAQELGLPEPPKRPLTPYIRFLMYHQADIQNKFSHLPHKEISKKVLQLWQNLNFHEKNQWSLAYERDKAIYDVKYTEYMKTLSPEQIRSIKDLKLMRSREKLMHSEEKVKILEEKKKRLEERLKNQERIQKEKECKELGKPKPPSPAFTLFLSAEYQEKVPLKKILKEAASRWHSLPEETKNWYQQKAKNLQEEYQHKLLDWENKMVKAGRQDLTRAGHKLSKHFQT